MFGLASISRLYLTFHKNQEYVFMEFPIFQF